MESIDLIEYAQALDWQMKRGTVLEGAIALPPLPLLTKEGSRRRNIDVLPHDT